MRGQRAAIVLPIACFRAAFALESHSMGGTTASRIGALVDQVTRYLAAHPSACDTAEGIRQRWLAGTAATPQEVSAALDHLVRTGSVERLLLQSSNVYRAKQIAGPGS